MAKEPTEKPYLSVPDWDEKQHYKDRSPPWIKLQNDLLENYDFECLQDASKAHLICIWLLASRTGNRINADPKWIQRKIGANSKVDIDELIAAGFLQLNQPLQDAERDASTSLAKCLPRERGEGEREESRSERAQDQIGATEFLPDWLNKDAWQEFEAHRREIKKPLTDMSRTKAINMLNGYSMADQQECINNTIQNRWTGLFPQKIGAKDGQSQRSNQPVGEVARINAAIDARAKARAEAIQGGRGDVYEG